jgi:hypothetical protein
MQAAADWLREHPEAKVNAAEVFGCSPEDVPSVALSDMRRGVEFAEALAGRAVEYGAPQDVQEAFTELTGRVRAGVAAINDRGPFISKTVASLVGLRELDDVRLVLRGALPHAPTEAERDLVKGLDETLADRGKGLKGGGSWWFCIIGCIACEAFCFLCCIILFEGDATPVS